MEWEGGEEDPPDDTLSASNVHVLRPLGIWLRFLVGWAGRKGI